MNCAHIHPSSAHVKTDGSRYTRHTFRQSIASYRWCSLMFSGQFLRLAAPGTAMTGLAVPAFRRKRKNTGVHCLPRLHPSRSRGVNIFLTAITLCGGTVLALENFVVLENETAAANGSDTVRKRPTLQFLPLRVSTQMLSNARLSIKTE